MVPRAVLTKSGLVSVNAARQKVSKTAVLVNTARQVNIAHPKSTVNVVRPMSYFSKTAHSSVKRPIQKQTAFKNSNTNQKVNTVRAKNVNNAKTKAVVNVVQGNNVHAVKASACWADPSQHMTWNMSYPTDYEEIDGGYVAFGGNPKGGKITGKADENHVLLRVHRKNNIYSVDLKNIVPKGGLTCLFAKATSDEFKLWHKRLGHLNFKTMNKLVKRNLVRDLPSKLFENEQNYVACQKGKQYRVSYDYSRFTWVFFLATKNETSGILKSFITRIENLVDHKVKVISVPRTPQQNRVAERRNRTLIEAARTMLASSKLPTTFWAKAVSTACYVQNKVLVVKPHNKTPYELFHVRTPTLSFMRPFGCRVTILNTIDHLGKFDGKSDEGFFVGYSLNSKAYRVFNSRTRIVEENLHIRFSESTPNVMSSGPDWLFDIDALTRTMIYEPVVTGTQSNDFANTKANDNTCQARKEKEPVKDYILLPLWTTDPPFSQGPKSSHDDGFKTSNDDGKKVDDNPRQGNECKDQEKEDSVNNTNRVNTASNVNAASLTVNAASSNEVNDVGRKSSIELSDDPDMPELKDISIFEDSYEDEDVSVEADKNNLDTTIQVSLIPTRRIHKDHPLEQVIQALKDPSWIEAMQEELLQFKLQEVWTLVDLPYEKRAIGSKWVFKNKIDERGIVIRNKVRLVAQGHTQEEGIDYDKSLPQYFLYGKIEEEVYVCQPPEFEDPDFPNKVYKVEKHFMDYIKPQKYGMKPCQHTCWTIGFKKERLTRPCSSEGTKVISCWYKSMEMISSLVQLRMKQKKKGIFISQDKYVAKILKKFGFTEVKTASTHMKTQKPLLKDEDGEEVDVYIYRSMLCSLMYITSSRLDIMFAVCACARYQVNSKVSHLHAVKRIFRYLKDQPKLCLWYLKDSLLDLEAYTDSDYTGASLDRKSTTGGCQFLRCRLISWQCKKQTVVAKPTTEAEYVAASSCCRQFWSSAKAKTINEEVQIHANVDGKSIILTESSVRRDLQLADEEGINCLSNSTIFENLTLMGMMRNLESSGKFLMYPRFVQTFLDKQLDEMPTHKDVVADEAVHEEMGDRLVSAITTPSSLEAEQDSGNIDKTQSKATPNEPSFPGTSSGGGPRCQEAIGDTTTQTSARVKSSSDEDLGEDASKQGRIDDIDADEDITLVSTHDGVSIHDDEFSVHGDDNVFEDVVEEEAVEVINTAKLIVDAAQVTTAGVDVTIVSEPVSTAATTVTTAPTTTAEATKTVEITQAPKVKGSAIQEPNESATTTTTFSSKHVKDKSKGKAILIEEPKHKKRKVQEMLDKEFAAKLQAEIDEEDRLARERSQKEQEEANVELINTWDDIQAKINADAQLAEQLQAQEQEELTDAKKAKLFVEFLEKRRKFFAAKRAEEKRNKPPTKAQQRNIMCNYLKNMEGWKIKDLKVFDFDTIQKKFNRAFKRVNTFVDKDTELVDEDRVFPPALKFWPRI
ncbi:putative ribonuclease H-like domain-containing protein [Tanacetum coccineum]